MVELGRLYFDGDGGVTRLAQKSKNRHSVYTECTARAREAAGLPRGYELGHAGHLFKGF